MDNSLPLPGRNAAVRAMKQPLPHSAQTNVSLTHVLWWMHSNATLWGISSILQLDTARLSQGSGAITKPYDFEKINPTLADYYVRVRVYFDLCALRVTFSLPPPPVKNPDLGYNYPVIRPGFTSRIKLPSFIASSDAENRRRAVLARCSSLTRIRMQDETFLLSIL